MLGVGSQDMKGGWTASSPGSTTPGNPPPPTLLAVQPLLAQPQPGTPLQTTTQSTQQLKLDTSSEYRIGFYYFNIIHCSETLSLTNSSPKMAVKNS
ncbi:hypothetical protein WA026_008909 [Henosepilachna vigintioctopunctata]|uniref:Uncharacterized protein n=1 Tax=Henosepilachna vigintioctopunctata TaxID=420089 RepID=A0AAW1V927_9CUCU